MITFHPVTLENNSSVQHMKELLEALATLKETKLIFTLPNSDTDGRILFQMIENFVKEQPNTKAFTSLGQVRYLSCIKYVDGVVGNSSSGLAEVPSFKKATINIGDRQRGRLKAESIIDCEPNKKSINNAIHKLYSSEFKEKLDTVENPYGSGGASEAIVNKLESVSLDGILKKTFYDYI
jgi:GDP/UDP-N,N'-diacetylbacillosamine 2-epimerase (hydrolysing)